MNQPDVITYLVGAEHAEAVQGWIETNKDELDRQYETFVATTFKIRPGSESDGHAHEDDYVDRMGRFYASEYVAKNQPWVQKLPFEEWLTRRQIGEVKKG